MQPQWLLKCLVVTFYLVPSVCKVLLELSLLLSCQLFLWVLMALVILYLVILLDLCPLPHMVAFTSICYLGCSVPVIEYDFGFLFFCCVSHFLSIFFVEFEVLTLAFFHLLSLWICCNFLLPSWPDEISVFQHPMKFIQKLSIKQMHTIFKYYLRKKKTG